MDAHEIVDWIEGRLDELKQRTDSSPLHEALDLMVAEARQIVEDTKNLADDFHTPTGEVAPQPGPS